MKRVQKQARVCRRDRSVAGMDELPLVLITDILSRLPVMDILSCRCVCKSWDDIITKDPHFIHLHGSRSKAFQPHSLLLKGVNWYRGTSDFFLISKPVNTKVWKKIKIPTAENIDGRIVASCNGMLCIENSSNLITIYNPFTKGRLILPELDFKHNSDILWYRYGFGFDAINKKYKVIVALVFHSYIPDSSRCFYKIGSKIISLGEDRWREIEFPSEVRLREIKPYFFNASFHWNPSSCFKGIAALDISTEKFHIMKFTPIPPNLPSSSCLIQMQNSLHIFPDANHPGYICIKLGMCKLMDAGTDRRIFYQHSNLSFNVKPERCVNLKNIKLLDATGDGDFLFIKAFDAGDGGENGRDRLLVCHSERDEASFIDLIGVPNFFDAIKFVPSLICPSTL